MTFDWRKLIDVAKQLSQRDDEASLRAAASRAYYAVFHEAKAYVKRKRVQGLEGDGRDHTAVWELVRTHGASYQANDAAQKGENLKELRTWADYKDEPGPPRLRDNVAVAVAMAERAVAVLAKL